jgi:phospholipase C
MVRGQAQPWKALIGLLLGCSVLAGLSGCAGFSTTADAAPPAKIEHVVIVFQENRTPDNLFQDSLLIARGADIAASGVNSKGQIVPLTEIDLGTNGPNPDVYDLSHAHSAFLAMYDNGKMDGADLVAGAGCQANLTDCLPENAQFKYVNPADVQPYFQLAEKYSFADRMFQTNQGPSFPAHQFIISGTSAPSEGSNLFVAENPGGISNPNALTGCATPAAEYVSVIDPLGMEHTIYPCFEHATLTDLLNTAKLSWRYYTPSPNSIWTGPNAIEHMCGPNAPPPYATECIGSDWVNNVVLSNTQLLTDITANQLAAVSWVMPTGLASDHALGNDGSGPSWVAAVVNAIGTSQYWGNTAIFITWDDWGGWYDHVAPPVINSYEYGFRVPLIVVSAYAKAGYISHRTHDFGSILKFTEENFNLPSLGYADKDADDLTDCFDFLQAPIKFESVAAPFKADYFLNDRRPPTDPDDD